VHNPRNTNPQISTHRQNGKKVSRHVWVWTNSSKAVQK